MEINSKLCRRLGSMSVPVLLSVVLLASCQDEIEGDAYTEREIRFTTSLVSQSLSSRAKDGLPERHLSRDTVQLLHGCEDISPLYLHTIYTDTIATPSSDLRTDTYTHSRGDYVTNTLYDTFFVSAYSYSGTWNGTQTPNLLYNIQAKKNGSNYVPSTPCYWPGSSNKVRFFAYTPKDYNQYTLSSSTTKGYPTLTVGLQGDVVEQHNDLLVASTSEMAGNSNTSVALSFEHILTAIQFKCGDDIAVGVLKSISFKNVTSTGTYNMGTRTWDAVSSQRRDFTVVVNKSVAGTPGESLATGLQTMMMRPQTLPSGAKLEVVFQKAGVDYTLTADISGTTWPMGETVTYKISTSSINWTNNLEITAPTDFTYKGATNQYSVTSYRENTKGVKEAIPWSAKFSENGGTTWSDTPPSWLTEFTKNGTGGETAQSCNATVAAQVGVVSGDTHTPILRSRASRGTATAPLNLAAKDATSTQDFNTANCYVVNSPGYYCFPLVYGCSIKNGSTDTDSYTYLGNDDWILPVLVNHLGNEITNPYIRQNTGCVPSKAELVWQDAPGLISNIQYNNSNISSKYTTPQNYITFEVKASTITQGNAVIAIKDASDNTLWSWHIWVTDEDLTKTVEVTTNSGKKFKFMPVNLGWCDGVTTTYAERSCKVRFTAGSLQKEFDIKQLSSVFSGANNTYYEWGRKDPFWGTSGYTPNADVYSFPRKTRYDKDGNQLSLYPLKLQISQSTELVAGVQKSILYPDRWQRYQSSPRTKNLWNSGYTRHIAFENMPQIKTIYDPSPAGFMIPPYIAFTGFTSTGGTVSKYDKTGPVVNGYKTDGGMRFYADASKTSTVFLAAAGTISGTGKGYFLGTEGWYCGNYSPDGGGNSAIYFETVGGFTMGTTQTDAGQYSAISIVDEW